MPLKTLSKYDAWETWKDKINTDLFGNPIIHSFDYFLRDTQALNLDIIGGNYRVGTTLYAIPDTTLLLTDTSDNYIVLNADSAALEVYTSMGAIPTGNVLLLYNFNMNEFEEVNTITDYRTPYAF